MTLHLNPMVEDNTVNCSFTVSCAICEGVTTGISASDRAVTIKTLINPLSDYSDIVTPGDMFPLRAKNGGAGQGTGTSAGLYPSSGVICEIIFGCMMALWQECHV